MLLAIGLWGGPLHAQNTEPISVGRDDTALDLTRAVTIYRDRGDSLVVSTAPDAEGIVRTVEVQATRPETSGNWAVFVLTNTSDVQVDRQLVAPHFRMVNSGTFLPDLGSPRIAAITPSSGFQLERVEANEADIFSITLDPGAVVTLVAELSSDALPQLYLWDEAAYKDIVNSYTLYHGIVIGISGLLALFLTILLVIRGNPSFAASAVLAWAALGYVLIDFGFASQFNLISGTEMPRWRAMSEATVAFSWSLFIFIHLRLNRWDHRLSIVAWSWLAAMGLLLVLSAFEPNIGAGAARFAAAVSVAGTFVLLIVMSIRGFDRAIMLLPSWSLLACWTAAGFMTIAGAIDNDIVQPALAGGLIMIVLLIGITIIQSAFAGGAFQQTLFSDTELQALAIRGSSDMVWDWDVSRDRIVTKPDLGRVIGLGRNALHGPIKTWLQYMHLDDKERFRTTLDSVVEGGKGRIDMNVRLRASDTRYDWFNVRARPVVSGDGKVIRCIGMTSNISGQKRMEERLLQDAVHDNLTGLPNKGLFLDRIQASLSLGRAIEAIVPTVMIVDVDNFSEIIDRIGVQGSDNLLMTLGRRLRIHLRNEETLARVGSDRFGILVTARSEAGEIAALAEAMLKAIRTPTTYADQEIKLTASLGLATWNDDVANADALFRDAEIALVQAKRYGGNRIEPFRPAFRDRTSNSVHLEADLRRALERNEIGLVYQPIIDAHSGSVAGLEAIMRWVHPRRGIVPPAEFLGIAENSDLIIPLGNRAIELVAEQLTDWEAIVGDFGLFVGVNVWPQQLKSSGFVSAVRAIMTKYPQRNHRIMLEFTETGIMSDPEHNARRLSELKAIGLDLALDDFGSGISSVSYLADLEIDLVKIDKQIVNRHGAKRAFMQSLIEMAHALDMRVVAEAADAGLQREMLSAMGADFAQSYATSAALTPENALALLAETSLKFDRAQRSQNNTAAPDESEPMAAQ
ncbi:MAG: GGDEF and EAL domain-containing protein [Pseudomonadota bacterium]